MCGIVGIVNPLETIDGTQRVLSMMNDAIVHRGPDDSGQHVTEQVGLAMRRLSIIDLEGGHQPIYNEDRSIVVVFNGEIYNYRELTERLKRNGHLFTTHSDTEVLVHLYEELGDACVDELRGMFAFAIWDENRQRLLMARDRLGIKPLYYVELGGTLVFASEIKAILQHPGFQAVPDLEALGNFLTLKYVPAPQTMFEGVRALSPGHSLCYDEHGMKVQRYWDLSFSANQNGPVDEDTCLEQLEALLRESVQLRLRSDVPFGAFLSGGVDSSLVVALMSQILDEPVRTFSVGFSGEGASLSELPFARLVAEQYETEHFEVDVTPQDFVELAETVVWHLDQPIADQAAVATYMLSRLASQHVKMVLTGQGGDELFAGYARYAGEQFSPIFRHVPSYAKSLALRMSDRVPGMRRPKVAFYALCQQDEITRMVNWFPLFNHTAKSRLLSDDLKQTLAGRSVDDVFAFHLAQTDAVAPLNRMLYVDTKLWLPDDLLARDDRMTMAASIEGRVPILDHNMVEFAASLPTSLKLKGLTRKYLLKKLGRKLLPAAVIDRKKAGFPMPVSEWFRKEARPYVRDILSNDSIHQRGLFNRTYVSRLLDEHESGFAAHGTNIWALLNIELWYRQFIDRPMPLPSGPAPSAPIYVQERI